MEFRQDTWGLTLSHVLSATGPFVNPKFPKSPPAISELLDGSGFEVSPQHRVAIWHGGYVESFRRIDTIVSWLNGTAEDQDLGTI
jgi:hypothetical protein